MSSAYASLVKSGFVGRLKRDVMLEADRDLEYVSAIWAGFDDEGRGREAVDCAVRLIADLIGNGLCEMATWAHNGQPAWKAVQKNDAELAAIVAESTQPEHCWEYFLVATPAGTAWVRRYDALVREL